MSRQDNIIFQCMLWVVFRIRVLHHLTCHSARRACTELQNPLFQLTKEHLLPGEKVPARADEWWGKVFFSGPQPSSSTVPSLPEEEGYFG